MEPETGHSSCIARKEAANLGITVKSTLLKDNLKIQTVEKESENN